MKQTASNKHELAKMIQTAPLDRMSTVSMGTLTMIFDPITAKVWYNQRKGGLSFEESYKRRLKHVAAMIRRCPDRYYNC